MSTFRQNDAATRGRFEKAASFFKVEDGVAYGWAIVCTEDGKPYWDLQDDHIPEDEMVEAAKEFMKNSRVGSDQHTGQRHGDIVFGYPVTAASNALGITSKKTGLLIGYQPEDADLLAKIAAGERTGFSIGGYLIEYDAAEVGKKVGKRLAGRAIAKDGSPDASDVYTPEDVNDQKKKKPKKTGKVYRRFKIDEISLVTKPAQEGATVAYVKGLVVIALEQPDNVFTSSDDGHQHVVDTDDYDDEGMGCTSCAITADGEWHSHSWMRKDDGSIAIADNAGHGHTTDAKATNVVEEPEVEDEPDTSGDGASGPVVQVTTVQLSAPKPAGNSTSGSAARSVAVKSHPHSEQPTMNEQEIKALQKRADRAEKMLDLSEAQRAYAKQLGESELDAYLAKGAADRETVAKGAVAYTAEDGTVYYDSRLAKLAKDNDELRKGMVLEKSLRLKAQHIAKAAETLGNYPEEVDVHAGIVEAIDKHFTDDAAKQKAFAVLKAGNAAFTKMGRPSGSNGAVDKKAGSSAQTEIAKANQDVKTAVEAFQKANNLKTYTEAFALATQQDPTTRDAYDRVMQLRRAGADESN